MSNVVSLPPLAERTASPVDTAQQAALDSLKAREAFEEMNRRLSGASPDKADDATLDDYDRRLLGGDIVQVRLNMALPATDVLAQLYSLRRAADAAIVIMESKTSTSAQRRIMAKRHLEASRNFVRDTRRAAGEPNAK